MKKVIKKRGQVWIETVIYTLIALILLATVLSFAKPKIEELQDKAIISQSIQMLEEIDNTIEEIKTVSGNKRSIELGIKKGSLTIDSKNDLIIFEIDSLYDYSEPGAEIKQGKIIIYDNKIGKINKINATLNYSGKYNITWDNKENLYLLSKSSTPYKLFISSKENNTINFENA